MRSIQFTPVEEDIIDSIAEQFDIPRLKAIEHFIEHKRCIMIEARHRGDHKLADSIKEELGE